MGNWGRERLTKNDSAAMKRVRTFIKNEKVKKPVFRDIFIGMEG